MIRHAAIVAASIACAATSIGVRSQENTMSTKPQPTASRAPPTPVTPVVLDGVRYAPVLGDIDRDGQFGGILGAFDASNRELWRLRVYENVRVPGLEGDVQDVFFHSMRMEGGRLLIENERNERFEVDLAMRRVVARHPAPPRSNIDPVTGRQRMPPPPPMDDDDF